MFHGHMHLFLGLKRIINFNSEDKLIQKQKSQIFLKEAEL